MTPERLKEIEKRADEGYGVVYDTFIWRDDPEATADVRELLAERKRLRSLVAACHTVIVEAWPGMTGSQYRGDESGPPDPMSRDEWTAVEEVTKEVDDGQD